VASTRDEINTYKVFTGKSEERESLEETVPGCRLILKCIFTQHEGRDRSGLIWFRIGTSGVLFEHGNETSGSVKRGKFLEQLTKIIVLFNAFHTAVLKN